MTQPGDTPADPTPSGPPPTLRGRRRFPVAGAVGVAALLLIGGYAAATAVFSARTRTLTQDSMRQLAATLGRSTNGVVTAEQTGYQKGFASSTQTMTVTIKPAAAAAPLRLLVTNHIQHGPLPGFSGVGQALVDTDITFADPQMQAQMDKLFAGQKPRIHTLVGLGGSTTSDVNVPGGTYAEGGDSATWQALTGRVTVSGGRTGTTMTWPGLSFTSGDGQAQIQGVSLSGDTARAAPDDLLGTGSSTLAVKTLNFTGSGQAVKMDNLKVTGQSKLNGQFFDGEAEYAVGGLTVEGKTLSDVQLHVGLRHLAREPLSRLLKTFQTYSQSLSAQAGQEGAGQGGMSATPELSAEQQQQVMQDITALIAGSPRLTIDRLSLRQPGGEVVVTGEATAPKLAGLSSEQMSLLMAAPQAAAGLLNVTLKAQATQTALRQLLELAGQGGGSDLEGTVQQFVQQGYVQQQGDRLSTTLVYGNGGITLNGKPLQQ